MIAKLTTLLLLLLMCILTVDASGSSLRLKPLAGKKTRLDMKKASGEGLHKEVLSDQSGSNNVWNNELSGADLRKRAVAVHKEVLSDQSGSNIVWNNELSGADLKGHIKSTHKRRESELQATQDRK